MRVIILRGITCDNRLWLVDVIAMLLLCLAQRRYRVMTLLLFECGVRMAAMFVALFLGILVWVPFLSINMIRLNDNLVPPSLVRSFLVVFVWLCY